MRKSNLFRFFSNVLLAFIATLQVNALYSQSSRNELLKITVDDYSNFSKTAWVIIDSTKKSYSNYKSEMHILFEYFSITEHANSLFKEHRFREAIYFYDSAFRICNDLGRTSDRFNAACSYAALHKIDSAFIHLNKIARNADILNYREIEEEHYFNNLRSDSRWPMLIESIKRKNQN